MEKDSIKYEAPRIEDHGDLTELTAAGSKGHSFDANFNAGDPVPPEFLTTP
jgi:hypothetical protein